MSTVSRVLLLVVFCNDTCGIRWTRSRASARRFLLVLPLRSSMCFAPRSAIWAHGLSSVVDEFALGGVCHKRCPICCAFEYSRCSSVLPSVLRKDFLLCCSSCGGAFSRLGCFANPSLINSKAGSPHLYRTRPFRLRLQCPFHTDCLQLFASAWIL